MKQYKMQLWFLAIILGFSFITSEVKAQKRLPDGTIIYPDGTKKFPNGTVIYPGGTTQRSGETVKLPDGTIIYPDGTRRHPRQTGTFDPNAHNGQWMPPGLAKKKYGGSARDYAPGQQKKKYNNGNGHGNGKGKNKWK